MIGCKCGVPKRAELDKSKTVIKCPKCKWETKLNKK